MVRERRETGFSGAVLVARNGKVLLAAGYGCANYELNAPNTADTPFKIGSISKAQTATAMLVLADRGLIALDDPVCKWISPCPAAWNAITLAQLMNHSSGIADFVRLPGFRDRITLPAPLSQTVEQLRALPLEHAPGAAAAYGNYGLVLCAAVIERVTGKPYAQAMEELVYRPMGLNRSGYAADAALIPGRASGYVLSGEGLGNAPYIDMTIPIGAGSQYATAHDLFAWEEAVFGGRYFGGKLLARMLDTSPFGYGLGWIDYSADGRKRIGHVGDINGFGSFLVRYPDQGLVVIVLSNVEKTRVRRIADDLAAVALSPP